MDGQHGAVSPVVTVNSAAIPTIGCGTWQLRGETCAGIVTEALRIGYNHVDTAQGYGNENEVGNGIRASGRRRDDIFVTTKVRPQMARDGDLQRSVEESEKRLQLDRLDLLLIHWPNPAVTIAETMRALSDAKRRGLTRHIGVSNFTIANLDEAIRVSPEPIITNQVEVHPYLEQTRVLAAIRRHGLAIIAYCPVALGKVVNDPVLKEIAAAHRRSSVQVALRWLIQHGDIVAIPRTSKIERLGENLAVFDFHLTAAEMDRISALKRSHSRLVNEPDWVPHWD